MPRGLSETLVKLNWGTPRRQRAPWKHEGELLRRGGQMNTDSKRLFRSDANGNVVLPATAVLSALPEQLSSRHGELGLRHPLGIYNTSVARVAERFSRVTKVLSTARQRGNELLDLQESLLKGLMEHMDDCVNILRGFTVDSRDFDKNRHVRVYRRAVDEYRAHIGKVVGRLKHQQGRLTLMTVQLETSSFAGYFVTVGLLGGGIGPDPDIHPHITAFSFNWDLRFHLCHFLLTSAHLAQAVEGLSGVGPIEVDPVKGELTDSMTSVMALRETYFPDEYRKKRPVLGLKAEPGGARQLVVDFVSSVGWQPLAGQTMQVTLTTRGDGVTRAWKIPYSNPNQVF